jgi:hypothetical protein
MRELVNKIDALMNDFRLNAEKNVMGNKSAGIRARKCSLEIEKLMKEYRKESVKNDK